MFQNVFLKEIYDYIVELRQKSKNLFKDLQESKNFCSFTP